MKLEAAALTFYLPELPNQVLSPNQRDRHSRAVTMMVASAKKKLRKWGKLHASDCCGLLSGSLQVSIAFCCPATRRDTDNLIAALKPYLDGIADGLGINDRQFMRVSGQKYKAQTTYTLVKIEPINNNNLELF